MIKSLLVSLTIACTLCTSTLIAEDSTSPLPPPPPPPLDDKTEGEAVEAVNVQKPAMDAATSKVDIEAGEKLYKKTCKNCHGPTAKGMASFPKLVDKEASYLIERLSQYRAGDQVGPNTALMAPQAATLSDADITNVSHFITSLKQ